MSHAYDVELRRIAKATAKEMGFESFFREGVYSMMVGPSFETVTECRYLKLIGVDATGETHGETNRLNPNCDVLFIAQLFTRCFIIFFNF